MRTPRGAIAALGVTVVALSCAPALAPPSDRQTPAPSLDAGGPSDASDASKEAVLDFQVRPPGCAEADTKARQADLARVGALLYAEKADARVVTTELLAALEKPCLAFIAPTIAPSLRVPTTIAALRKVWGSGLAGILDEATKGLRTNHGALLLAIPPEPVPDLTPDARRDLTWMICAAGDSSCDRARSYITRAEEAFDARAHAEERSSLVVWQGSSTLYVDVRAEICRSPRASGAPPPATFEAWASCVATQAPRNRRYAEPRLRAPERGWLVLRGRRGHYDFADEIRAYDLATGAAYVARNAGALVAVGASKPGPDAFTGRLAVDQLRELAFALLTRDAVVEVRTAVAYAAVPQGVPLALGASDAGAHGSESWGRIAWSASDQTQIAWAFDEGTRARGGTFTWPNAHDWVDDQIDHLVRVSEAGLVQGCAPALLPSKLLARSRAGGIRVSPVDADAAQLAGVYRDLEQRLEALRTRACAGAR